MFKATDKTEKVSESIITQIRDAILSGKVKPGDRLASEKELLSQFSVSKATMREALRVLESMGLIEIRKGVVGGVFIAEVDMKRLRAQKKELQDAEDRAIGSAKVTENMVKEQSMWIKKLKSLKESLENLVKERDELRQSWLATDESEFVPVEGENLCPTCGQSLPAGQVEEAARLAVENFNSMKAKVLAGIAVKGQGIQGQIDAIEKSIEANTTAIKTADQTIIDLTKIQDDDQKAVDDLKAHHEKVNLTTPPDVELDDMIVQEDTLTLEINSLSAGNAEAVLAAEGDLSRVNEMLSILSQDELQIAANLRVATRIQELSDQEIKLSQEYEKLESDLYAIDSFIRTKVSMLEAKINKKFNHATFRLFIENINGGLEECCDTTYQGVPYNSMNNGARINIGLDICNTLSQHYGISLPCFIDNAEAVSKIIDTNAQQIRLFVSEADKKLRIENS